MDEGTGRPGTRLLLGIVAVVLLGWAIKGLAVVLMPLAAAILVALAVMPVRDWVRARVSPGLSVLGVAAAMAVVLLLLLLLVGLLGLAARQLVAGLPVEPGAVVEAVTAGTQAAGEAGAGGADGGGVVEGAEAGAAAPEAGGDLLGGLLGDPGSALRSLGERALGAAGGAAGAVLNSTLGVLGGVVLVLFLTLLILAESGEWRQKVGAAASWGTEWHLRESAEVIAGKVRAYLLAQALLGLASAALYALWLWLWGVDLILVWALLILALNFIPTVGSLVGGTLPVAFAALTIGPGAALGVGAGIVVIETVMGNLVGPKVQGRNVALSPLVVLVALVFWGWAWGVAGALLAVPVTVALVVLGAHVPALRPWALMLSNQTDWAGLDAATHSENA